MPAVLFLAIGATAAWGWAVAAIRLRGRGRRGVPAPGSTPPAVLAVLDSAGRGDPRVLNAALMELAALGALQIIPANSQGPALVRPAAVPAAGQLPRYLDVLVARLMLRCGPQWEPIPLTAMRPDEDRKALAWSRDFDKAVRREATARGLMQAPVRQLVLWPLLLSGLVPSSLIDLTLAHYWKEQTFIPFVAFLLIDLLTFSAAAAAVRVRVTPAGAAALHAARQAMRSVPAPLMTQGSDTRILPRQRDPLPPNQMWSNYGGSWHPLDLESREVYSASASRSPLLGITCLAGFCAVSVGTEARHSHHLPLLTAVVFLGLPAAVLAAIAARAVRRRNLPRYVVLQGKVARLWSDGNADPRANAAAGRRPASHSCTLDVGRAPASVRLDLGPRTYQNLEVGDIVEVAVRPRRGTISGLRNLGGDF